MPPITVSLQGVPLMDAKVIDVGNFTTLQFTLPVGSGVY